MNRYYAMMDEVNSQQVAIVDRETGLGLLTTGSITEWLWEPEPIGDKTPEAWATDALETYAQSFDEPWEPEPFAPENWTQDELAAAFTASV